MQADSEGAGVPVADPPAAAAHRISESLSAVTAALRRIAVHDHDARMPSGAGQPTDCKDARPGTLQRATRTAPAPRVSRCSAGHGEPLSRRKPTHCCGRTGIAYPQCVRFASAPSGPPPPPPAAAPVRFPGGRSSQAMHKPCMARHARHAGARADGPAFEQWPLTIYCPVRAVRPARPAFPAASLTPPAGERCAGARAPNEFRRRERRPSRPESAASALAALHSAQRRGPIRGPGRRPAAGRHDIRLGNETGRRVRRSRPCGGHRRARPVKSGFPLRRSAPLSGDQWRAGSLASH